MFTTFDRHNVHVQKSRKLKTKEKRFLVNSGRLTNRKGPGFWTKSSKPCKIPPKNIVHDYIY